MAVNGVEIAVGQVWRTRGGEEVTLARRDDDDQRVPWMDTAGLWYKGNGKTYGGYSSQDLVELISDPNASDDGWLRRVAAPEQPAATKGQQVQVKHADGTVFHLAADDADWSLVVAYRLTFDSAAPVERVELPAPSPLDVQVGGDHYKKLGIQPVEYMHANGIPFMEGCAIKYLTRWRDKGGIADLEKAKHFIDLLIALEQKAGAQ